MAAVRTTDGRLVRPAPGTPGITEEDAKKDADRRNEAAKKLGIKTRYEVTEE